MRVAIWPIESDGLDVYGHIAYLYDVAWLDIFEGWHLIWTTNYEGISRLRLPRNWCLIGLG